MNYVKSFPKHLTHISDLKPLKWFYFKRALSYQQLHKVALQRFVDRFTNWIKIQDPFFDTQKLNDGTIWCGPCKEVLWEAEEVVVSLAVLQLPMQFVPENKWPLSKEKNHLQKWSVVLVLLALHSLVQETTEKTCSSHCAVLKERVTYINRTPNLYFHELWIVFNFSTLDMLPLAV